MEFLGTSNRLHVRNNFPIREDNVLIVATLFLEYVRVLSPIDFVKGDAIILQKVAVGVGGGVGWIATTFLIRGWIATAISCGCKINCIGRFT
jgi:hypothetical protein